MPLVTVKGQIEVALSSAYLVLLRDHSPSLCFTESPDKQFCAHNKDFPHENIVFSRPFLYMFQGISWFSVPAGRGSLCVSGSVTFTDMDLKCWPAKKTLTSLAAESARDSINQSAWGAKKEMWWLSDCGGKKQSTVTWTLYQSETWWATFQLYSRNVTFCFNTVYLIVVITRLTIHIQSLYKNIS